MRRAGYSADTRQKGSRVKFKLHDKRAALVDLGRHLGMFQGEPGRRRTFSHITLDLGEGTGEPEPAIESQ